MAKVKMAKAVIDLMNRTADAQRLRRRKFDEARELHA
jgi:hypothetical protein